MDENVYRMKAPFQKLGQPIEAAAIAEARGSAAAFLICIKKVANRTVFSG
jgi:hypothetical protein